MSLRRPGLVALAFVAVLLTSLGSIVPAAAGNDGLLPAKQAFHLTADASQPGVVKLHWDIAPHYYMYRGRIHVKNLDHAAKLGKIKLPDGTKEHDEYLGNVEIYHNSLDATLPYTATSSGGKLKISMVFQGCHEVDPKICYPPITQVLNLPIPAAAAGAGAARAETSSTAPGGAMPGGHSLLSRQGRGSGGDQSALPPQQAFRFEAIATSPQKLLLRWTMPGGYYLYRDQTQLSLTGSPGLQLGAPQWPTGIAHHDAHNGDAIVYFNQVQVPVPLKGAAHGMLTLKARFQGCKEHGICYPPMTRTIKVDLPAGGAAHAASSPAPVPPTSAGAAGGRVTPTPALKQDQSATQKLAGSLAGHSRWLALLAFFGAGLLLAFTPCVLPMVPILSGLIAGAGEAISTARAFVLSVVYVLASSVVFVIAGIAAGLAGTSLQAAFQQPWILWSFAALFVLLSLSMFGFYELQLPTAWQNKLTNVSNKQRSGSLAGVAVMGVLSALIVGPCVAPPLAAAVLYIGQQHDPVFGGVALFALSLGMGVPLVIFGTAAGKLLPRAGAWMNTVKAVFGVLFLALAIWMLSRILDTVWIMLLSGALLVACAIYMGALERVPADGSGWRRLWKALGVIMLLFGAAELVGVTAGSQNLLQPLQGVGGSGPGSAAARTLRFRRVATVKQLDQALQNAASRHTPVMLDFYADWCVSCKEMEHRTFTNAEVQQALSNVELLQVDVTANTAADKALLHRFDLIGPPATMFFAPGGGEVRSARLIGFENARTFVRRVDAAIH